MTELADNSVGLFHQHNLTRTENKPDESAILMYYLLLLLLAIAVVVAATAAAIEYIVIIIASWRYYKSIIDRRG